MQSAAGIIALVGAVAASSTYEYPQYSCVSVDKRADDYWCNKNCLDLDGNFNDHPACFIDYSEKSVHTVCQCEMDYKTPKEYGGEEYVVKITNLAFNQPLSRPVVFAHNEHKQLFKFNGVAGKGLRIVAEDGNPDVLEKEVLNDKNVGQVVVADGIPPRQSVTTKIYLSKDFPFLSLASMAINTNDCFVAVNGEYAYNHKYSRYGLPGLDAGTEANNELCTHIPGPACTPESGNQRDMDGAEGFIHVHRGIHGVNVGEYLSESEQRAAGGPFQPKFYDWRNNMALIEVYKA
eukprot:Awhi_evm1s5789